MLKQVLELQSVLEDARARAARIQEERKSNEIEQKWLRDMIDSLILQLEAYQKQVCYVILFKTQRTFIYNCSIHILAYVFLSYEYTLIYQITEPIRMAPSTSYS